MAPRKTRAQKRTAGLASKSAADSKVVEAENREADYPDVDSGEESKQVKFRPIFTISRSICYNNIML